MGMTSFNVQSQSRLTFNTTAGLTTSVTTTMSYKKLTFMYWSLKYRGCPPTNPYFQLSSELCFDICPDGSYPDTVLKMCLDCHYTCQTCASVPDCTGCDPLKFRSQVGLTCPPINGYFDNGTAEAVLCSTVMSYCTLCSDNVTC